MKKTAHHPTATKPTSSQPDRLTATMQPRQQGKTAAMEVMAQTFARTAETAQSSAEKAHFRNLASKAQAKT